MGPSGWLSVIAGEHEGDFGASWRTLEVEQTFFEETAHSDNQCLTVLLADRECMKGKGVVRIQGLHLGMQQ